MKILCSLSTCFSPSVQDETAKQGRESEGAFRVFTYGELKSATRSFDSSNKIGEGGFGTVYKGRLLDGTFVAVKVLSIELDSLRGEKEFVAELSTLGNIKHENLVTLRGCCVEGTDRYLVYEFMENNSLRQYFLVSKEGRMRFDWESRREVSIGVARGLAYLHEEVKPYIVHRDIKARNILLDRRLRPKVSDFGLAKLLRDDKSYVSTQVAGTLGYLAPEYASSGKVTRKSDVYSYGILLLEIVSGLPVVDPSQDTERFLVEKAWAAYEAGDLPKMVDEELKESFPEEESVRFLKVGLLCVQETAKLRPRMTEVVEMLSNNIEMASVSISKPGLVPDLRAIRIKNAPHSEASTSRAATHASSIWSSANLGR
ncbi:putative serine/threonine-protein kinase [Neltuma alba]|uniref:putative serine/threonine-protein kinase n=1 Tax=Neltuma alba TaxID=207710 RepID=UPI0010A36E16|nr:putative serine/threonine-protein kinase [Prosopis alba]